MASQQSRPVTSSATRLVLVGAHERKKRVGMKSADGQLTADTSRRFQGQCLEQKREMALSTSVLEYSDNLV